MLRSISEVIQEFLYEPTFNLSQIPDFPWEDYLNQRRAYFEAERWFDGKMWEETIQTEKSAGEKYDLYPTRINPLNNTIQKHAYMLMGETEPSDKPLVVTKIVAAQEQLEAAQHAEDLINTVYWQSGGRAVQIRNALLSQIYGGCIFKLTYLPWETERIWPFAIETILPKEFIGYPQGGDPYRLNEAWVFKQIHPRLAKDYGFVEASPRTAVWYTEHWTRDLCEICVNGQPVQVRINKEMTELPTENPFGFVPLVYIPHIRVSRFYGENVIDNLKGLINELNRVFGDFEDAVNDDSHPIRTVANTNGQIRMERISPFLEVVQLGSNQDLSGNGPEPNMKEIHTPSANGAMDQLLDQLWEQYSRDSFVPEVANGTGEASQRSGTAMGTRFWPLLAHAGIERFFWTPGLDLIANYLLRMFDTKKIGGLDPNVLKLRTKQMWAPMLPKDRESFVNELVNRSTTDLGSIDHLLEMTGDVDNIEEEKGRMLDWKRELAQIQLEISAEQEKQRAALMAKQGAQKDQKNKTEK